MLKRISSLLFLCVAFAAPWPAIAHEEHSPYEIIETAANEISRELKGRKGYLSDNRD